MPFKLEHITTQMRVKLGCLLVANAAGDEEYGLVTRLARHYGVSRQFLYELKERTEAAAEASLSPKPPGRRPSHENLGVVRLDRLCVERAILVLSQVAHASVRAIAECLEEMLGVDRSIGTIQGVLTEAGRRAARAVVVAGEPEGAVCAVADELYAAGKPVLEIVDHHSALILALEPAEHADETSWGVTWLELLQERGVAVDQVLSDGGRGLRAGIRAAAGGDGLLPEPCLDHWHTLRDLGGVERQMEKEAYERLETLERIEREAQAQAYQLAHGKRPQSGRPLEVATEEHKRQEARKAAEEALMRYEDARYVLGVARGSLAPVDARTGRIRRAEWVRAELEAGGSLLMELGGRAERAGKFLKERAQGLVAYLERLRGMLKADKRTRFLGEEEVAFCAWAWRHREVLGLEDAAEAWPTRAEAARAVWSALDEGSVRSTGMVENLGSLLAAHRASHRGLPESVLRVFRVYRNHRIFARGKRAGRSPMELAGLPSAHWLEVLGYGRESASQKNRLPAPTPNESVSTLAA